MRHLLNMLQEIIIMNLDDKYFIKLNRYDLSEKNIFEAINKENKNVFLLKILR